jgi:hypothetical protein
MNRILYFLTDWKQFFILAIAQCSFVLLMAQDSSSHKTIQAPATTLTTPSTAILNCTPPTATVAASSSTCNGQPVGLRLESATGTGPFTLVINGTSYTNVKAGSTFTSIPFPDYTLFPSNPTPAIAHDNDGQSIEAGIKFRSSQAGFIKGIRFYNGTSNAGTYTGKLWSFSTGSLIGSAVFSNVTTNGWQQVTFAAPVAIAANTTYIASYFSSAGNYAVTDNYLTNAITNGPLTALADNGLSGSNGLYKYGAGMPNTPYAATNYWVDVIFTPNTNNFDLTSITDKNGCNNSGALQVLTVTSADCSSLPVTLLNLSASPNGKKVLLRWSTSSEINNKGFDVLRSTDGVNWTSIAFVRGAGNSHSARSYSYPDNNPGAGPHYYKLKQIDTDEKYKYSITVSALIGSKGEYVLGQNFPNPFSNTTTIQYTLPQAGQVNLSVFDINGRVIKVLVNASNEAGTHAISFSTGSLTKGIYYYRMQAGDFTDVKKMTIQ